MKLLFFLLVSSHQKEHLFFICLFIQTVLDEFFVCVYKSKCAFTNNEVYFITSQSVLLTICYVVTIFSTSNVMSVKSVEFLFFCFFDIKKITRQILFDLCVFVEISQTIINPFRPIVTPLSSFFVSFSAEWWLKD